MGLRLDSTALLDALIARLAALNLTGRPVIEEFEGDTRSLNADAVFPHLAVNVGMVEFGDDQEAGPVVTNETTDFLEIIVSTANRRAGKGKAAMSGQYRAGLDLCDAVRTKLNGFEIARGRFLGAVDQQQDIGVGGIYEWTIRFKLKQLDSRARP